MLLCETCGQAFPIYAVVEGKSRNLRGRKHCLDCRPYRPLSRPRRRVERARKSLVCEACGRQFPAKQLIDGKMRSLYRRKFCLDCSPFGKHNTSKEPVGGSADADLMRRRRRGKSWVRYQRKRRHERKRRLVELRGGCCEDCGYAATVAALEFHHRDSVTKEFSLGNFTGSWDRLLREAAKCDLVCANCHRRRHAAMWPGTAQSLSKKLRAIELMGGACFGCRGDVPTVALEFHHWNATEKEFGISRDGMTRPWEAILVELAKCVMLCANCHREVHAGVRRIERQSGLTLAKEGLPEPTAA